MSGGTINEVIMAASAAISITAFAFTKEIVFFILPQIRCRQNRHLKYYFFQVDGEKRTSIGKSSSLPAIISKVKTSFEGIEKNA